MHEMDSGLAGGVQVTRGRPGQCIKAWKNMGASAFVLDMIENGYRLLLRCEPERKFLKNHKSCLSHADFVAEAIEDLVSRGCAKEVE